MSCALVQGYSKSCRDAQGGVIKFYITELSNLATLTSASGVVTAMTLSTGKKFWTYEQEINTAEYTETITVNRQAGTNYVEQEFKATLLKRAAAISYELRALSAVNVMIVAEEQNAVSGVPTRFLLGATSTTMANGLALEASPSKSGKAMGDMNGYELTFKGQEPFLAPTVSAAILATLIVPAS